MITLKCDTVSAACQCVDAVEHQQVIMRIIIIINK